MKNAVLLLLLVCAPLVRAELQVTDAWARETVPGTNTSALFATVENTALKSVQLVAVQVDGVEKAELHAHKESGGMMRMRRVASIDIGARATVTLAPGGYHVMLFQLSKPLRADTSVGVTFQFSNGDKVRTEAKVLGMGQSLHQDTAEHSHHH